MGLSMRRIAEKFGITSQDARRIRDHGIVACYMSGLNMEQTAARFGVSVMTVSLVVNRDRPKVIRRGHHNSGRKRREVRNRELIEFYADDHTTWETARKFGLKSHKSVLEILHRDAPHLVRGVGFYFRGFSASEIEMRWRTVIAWRRAQEDAAIEATWPSEGAWR
jgi:transposase